MLVNQITPIDIKERVCIHGSKTQEEHEPVGYLIAERGQGKSTETLRQAAFRGDTILSTEYDFYRSLGLKHYNDAKEGELAYFGMRDLINKTIAQNKQKEIHLCVDNAKTILEFLLSEYLDADVTIDFMALEV